MPERPTEEFAIWLLNKRREWWSLALLVISLGAGLTTVYLLTAVGHAGQEGFWLGLGSWGIAVLLAYRRFTKWASDPATAVVSAEGLAVRSEATGYALVVAYGALKECSYEMVKDVAFLRLVYPDGRKVLLRTFYKQKDFDKMATSCEQRFNAYWLQVRLNRPRARR